MALGHWWITLMMNSFSFFLRNAIIQKQFLILKEVGHISIFNAGDVWSLIHSGFLSMHITIHCTCNWYSIPTRVLICFIHIHTFSSSHCLLQIEEHSVCESVSILKKS